MNTLGIYAIKDSKAEAYLPPFTVRTNGEAVRMFDDCIQRDGTPLHDHSEDFFLYKLGEIDLFTGVVTRCDPVSLGAALDFVKSDNNIKEV